MLRSMRQIAAGTLITALLTASPLQAGEKDVIVINTPDVNVANAPDVIVGNALANPVPVTIADPMPSSQRVRILLGDTKDCGAETCGNSFETGRYHVPEGKTLLIDEVSCEEIFAGLDGYAWLSIAGYGEPIQIPKLGQLTVAGGRSFAARSVRMHTTGIVSVGVSFDQVPSGHVRLEAIIFGRLVDGTDEVIDLDP